MAIQAIGGYGLKPKAVPKPRVPNVLARMPSDAGGRVAALPVFQTPEYATAYAAARAVRPNSVPGTLPPTAPPSLDKNPNKDQLGQPINYMPSLQEIEQNDLYQKALLAYNTQRNSDRRALQSAIAGLAVRSGYDLSGGLSKGGLGDYSGDIDPTTAADAAANPFSDRAQIQQALDRGQHDLLYSQNARGTLASGAYTSGDTGLLEQSQLAANTAQGSTLDAIRQAVNSYLQGGVTGEQNLKDTRLQVGSLLAQQPGAAYNVGNDVGNYEAGYQTVPGTKGVPSSAPGVPTGSIMWNGRPFTTVADLTRELNRTGVSYARWKANHLDAARKLEGGI